MVIREAVRNTDLTVGAALAAAIVHQAGDAGLPEAPVRLELSGHAGQSLGAFGVPGLDIYLAGDANDGVGKGLHGGTIAIRPPSASRVADQVLVGNAALYGATGGALYVAGRAGERFAVRNSGATAVVEGVGHHGCEYMTGGVVAVLGSVGPNFGAGMTGGVAYIHDPDRRLEGHLNTELVSAEPLCDDDEARLLAMLTNHRAATGSGRAAAMLDNWPRTASDFTSIVPRGLARRAETTRVDPAEHPALHAHPGAVAAAAGTVIAR
jgi:glutamate synthase domain-containing protein 3